jgi:hydrogenase small subunit
VGCGAPCFGCTEQGVGFTKPIHALADVLTVTPPTAFPRVGEPRGEGITPGAAALVAGVAGAALGAGAVLASRLGKAEPAAAAAAATDETQAPKR